LTCFPGSGSVSPQIDGVIMMLNIVIIYLLVILLVVLKVSLRWSARDLLAGFVLVICIPIVVNMLSIWVSREAISIQKESKNLYTPVGPRVSDTYVTRSRVRERDGCPTNGGFNDPCVDSTR